MSKTPKLSDAAIAEIRRRHANAGYPTDHMTEGYLNARYHEMPLEYQNRKHVNAIRRKYLKDLKFSRHEDDDQRDWIIRESLGECPQFFCFVRGEPDSVIFTKATKHLPEQFVGVNKKVKTTAKGTKK